MRALAWFLTLCSAAATQEAPGVQQIATGFRFVEGPAWDPLHDRLLFSDIPANKVYAYDGAGEPRVFLQPSGNSNGLVFDAQGNLYLGCHGTRHVLRIAPDGQKTVLAERYGGKRLNSPNDLCLDDHGGIYFTDPRYGNTGDIEQDVMGVYYRSRSGVVTRVIDDLGRPNGIVLSNDGGVLYVAQPDRRKLWCFPVLRPGEVGGGRAIFTGDPELDGGGPDGMALDADGRIYTTYAGIVVHEPDGRVIRRIPIPERPANCVIGGKGGKTLFVTARTSLYSVSLAVEAAPLRSPPAPRAAAPPQLLTRREVIDGDVQIGYGVACADVDGDDDLDIVLVDRHTVAWYSNPNWTRHVIAERLTQRDHVCIAARDVDRDGRADIAVGAEWNPADTENSGSVHVLEPARDRTAGWRSIPLPHEPTVHRMRWLRLSGRFELVVAPLHGRGNKNAQGAGACILAYRRPANPAEPWPTTVVSDAWHQTHNVDPVEWDADADQELLVCGREGLFLCDRTPDGSWQSARLTGPGVGETHFRGASEVRLGRGPGGSRYVAAIEPFHGHQLTCYTEPEPGSPRGFWMRQVVADDLIQGHALATGDLLGLGYDQIVVGWRGNRPGDRVGIWLYVPPKTRGGDWHSVALDAETACEDLRLADLDGDGDLDVVAAGRWSRDLVVLWNRAR